jgi:hypothetical protein
MARRAQDTHGLLPWRSTNRSLCPVLDLGRHQRRQRRTGRFILETVIATGGAMCWFIGIGSLFLAWLGRKRGVIERFTCLALCATLTFFLPFIGALVDFTTTPAEEASSAFLFFLALGAAAIGLVLTAPKKLAAMTNR